MLVLYQHNLAFLLREAARHKRGGAVLGGPLSKKRQIHVFFLSFLSFLKSGCFSPKIENKKKKLSKFVSGNYKTLKKWHGPLSHWCGEGKTVVARPLKKNTFFMCVFPYRDVVIAPVPLATFRALPIFIPRVKMCFFFE